MTERISISPEVARHIILPATVRELGREAILSSFDDDPLLHMQLARVYDEKTNEIFSVLSLSDGDQIAFVRRGKKDVPIITLHGNPGSRRGPLTNAGEAYRLGLDVITPDRWGYGLSTRKRGRNIASFAVGVVAIMNALEISQACVSGRSGGGPVALACAALYPDRFVNVGLLASVAPPQYLEDVWSKGMAASNRQVYEIATELSAAEAYVANIANLVKDDPRALLKILDQEGVLTPSDHETLLHGQANIMGRAHREGLRDFGWADGIVAVKSHDWGFDPRDVTQPVFMWHGDDDKCVPISHSEWYEANLPNAKLTVARGEGHFGASDAWADVAIQQREHFRQIQAPATT